MLMVPVVLEKCVYVLQGWLVVCRGSHILTWPSDRVHINKTNKSFFFNLFLLFLAVLGLCCCMQASSSCSEWELLSNCGAQAPHYGSVFCCGARTLGYAGSSSHGARSQLPCSMWNPGPRIKPMSPALTGGLPTLGPAGKSPIKTF